MDKNTLKNILTHVINYELLINNYKMILFLLDCDGMDENSASLYSSFPEEIKEGFSDIDGREGEGFTGGEWSKFVLCSFFNGDAVEAQ